MSEALFSTKEGIIGFQCFFPGPPSFSETRNEDREKEGPGDLWSVRGSVKSIHVDAKRRKPTRKTGEFCDSNSSI